MLSVAQQIRDPNQFSNLVHWMNSIDCEGLEIRFYQDNASDYTLLKIQAWYNDNSVAFLNTSGNEVVRENEAATIETKTFGDARYKSMSSGAESLRKALETKLSNLTIDQRATGTADFSVIEAQNQDLKLYQQAKFLNDKMSTQYPNSQMPSLKQGSKDATQYYLTGANEEAILEYQNNLLESRQENDNLVPDDLDMPY